MEQVQRYGQNLGGVTPFDEEVEKSLGKLHPGEKPKAPFQEASAQKMRQAQSGGSPGLGPTSAEAALAKQRGMLQQQAAAQGQQQATQAQGQQPVNAPPPAPSGPEGVSEPYSAQAGEVGQPGKAIPPQQPGQS